MDKRQHMTLGDYISRKPYPDLSGYSDMEISILHEIAHKHLDFTSHIHILSEKEKRGILHKTADIMDRYDSVCEFLEADFLSMNDDELMASWAMLSSCWNMYNSFYETRFPINQVIAKGRLVGDEIRKRRLLATLTVDKDDLFARRTLYRDWTGDVADLTDVFTEAIPVDHISVKIMRDGDSIIFSIHDVDRRKIMRSILARQGRIGAIENLRVIERGEGSDLYRLVLYKVPRKEHVPSVEEALPKPLRPRSPVKGNVYTSFAEMWHGWGARYIRDGIVVQPTMTDNLFTVRIRGSGEENLIETLAERSKSTVGEFSEEELEEIRRGGYEGVYFAERGKDGRVYFTDIVQEAEATLYDETYIERLRRLHDRVGDKAVTPSVLASTLGELKIAIEKFNGRVHLRSTKALYNASGRTRMFVDYDSQEPIELSLVPCPFKQHGDVCLTAKEAQGNVTCELSGRYRCLYLPESFYEIEG